MKKKILTNGICNPADEDHSFQDIMVYYLPDTLITSIIPYFKSLLREQEQNNLHKNDVMRVSLFQLCLCISRSLAIQHSFNLNTNNYNIMRNF